MVAGQAIDLAAVGNQLTLEQMETMHLYKTGALIRACLRIAALAQGVDQTIIERLDRYGRCIGLAFQIRDDILDVTGDSTTVGKAVRKDAEAGKATFVSLLGLDEARRRAGELVDEACDSLSAYGAAAETLRETARFIIARAH